MERNIDIQTVEKVAAIARLNLSKAEAEKLLRELDTILEAFHDLEEADADDLKPTFHPLGVENVLREDVPKKGLSQEQALKNAKHKEGGYIRGPKVI